MSNESTAKQTLTADEHAELLALRAMKAAGQIAKPKADTTKLIDGISVAVSQKGAISIYGLGRFPVTLYRHQFNRLATVMGLIQTWANQPEISAKLVVKPVAIK